VPILRYRALQQIFYSSGLDIAIESLRVREGIPKGRRDDFTGVISINDALESDPVLQWLLEISLDAVIWTDLPSKFNGLTGNKPSKQEAIAYLQNLKGDTRKAEEEEEEYIRKAHLRL
jgi:hypothetical protein